MIHNRPIYHCQCCGAVITQESQRQPPFCCGQVMFKAAEETWRDDFAPERDFELILSDSLVGQNGARSTLPQHFASS